MHVDQLNLIRDSFREISLITGGAVGVARPALAEAFFARLFRLQPMLRTMFAREAWQRDRDMMAALGLLVKNLHRVEAIGYMLEDTGARAQLAGAQPLHFGLARDAMLGSMHDALGQSWTHEHETAWSEALNMAISLMLRGAGRARLRAA